ncbi:MAG TPA: ATP-binding protein [Noviherbaspirillum sp.]
MKTTFRFNMTSRDILPAEHYQLLFENAPSAFLILRPNEHFTIAAVSNAYLHDTLTKREQILGKPVFDVFPDNPHTPEANSTRNLMASLKRVVSTRSTDTMGIQRYDVPGQDGDGFEVRYWSPVNAPVMSPEGDVLYIIHRVQNVTDYMRLAEENAMRREESVALTARNRKMEAEILQHIHTLDEKNRELQYANAELMQYARQASDEARSKDEFLAMLAHELRNPLAGISTALELMGMVGDDAAKTRQYREVCKRQVGNLTRLVDDLLDVSRVSRGAVHLQHQPLDLRDVVESALHAVRGPLDAKALTVTTNITSGTYQMLGDATRLEQVLTNLLVNAAKYSDVSGRVDIGLRAETTDNGPWAVLEVKDAGRGIPPEKLTTIFDLFVQVDTELDRAHGGLGIGLTLVQKLIEMHGGSVVAYSQGLGCGSTFTVRLPLGLPMAAAAPDILGTPVPRPDRTDVRVLVVEDNVDARDTLKSLLEAYGYSVEVAATGEEGLRLLLAQRPDVAIVDIGLPGLDGFEIARRVRGAPEASTIKLVALSGYSGPDTEQKAAEAGFDLHLVKPINVVELPGILKKSLR